MSTLPFKTARMHAWDVPRAEFGERGSVIFAAFVAVLVTFAFTMPITESWKHSTYENFDNSIEEAEASVREGSLSRQVAIGGLGLLGLAALAMAGWQATPRSYRAGCDVCCVFCLVSGVVPMVGRFFHFAATLGRARVRSGGRSGDRQTHDRAAVRLDRVQLHVGLARPRLSRRAVARNVSTVGSRPSICRRVSSEHDGGERRAVDDVVALSCHGQRANETGL